MMVMQTFRNNQISGMVWLVLVWLTGSVLRILSDSIPGDFGQGVLAGASLPFPWAGVLWSAMLLVNGLLTNTIFIRLNQFDQTSLLPGLLAILVGLIFPGLDTALANLFLLMAFFFMLPPPGQSVADVQVFNAGMLFGLGALTYFPLLTLLVIGPMILGITGRFKVRRALVWYSAFALPWLYAAFLIDFQGDLAVFTTNFIHRFGLPAGLNAWFTDLWISLAFITVSGFLGLWKYSKFSGRLKVAQRRTFTLFTLIFVAYLLSGGLVKTLHPMHFQLMAMPLGLFISFALFHEKRGRVAWITLISWHFMAFLSIFQFFISQD